MRRYADIAPPAVARGWKIGGYPLFDGLTRDDFRKSFDKMVGLVGRLHKAGVRIVAGTDGYGLELVRELELYQQAGLTNAEALQTATIVPARMTGMDDRTGSIARGQDRRHHPGRRRRVEGPRQPAPCRDRVRGRLPARRRRRCARPAASPACRSERLALLQLVPDLGRAARPRSGRPARRRPCASPCWRP